MSACTPGACVLVAHEVPLFCVVQYVVVLNDNIELPFHGDILFAFFLIFFSYCDLFLLELKVIWGSLYADLCCNYPLKAQLEYCGFSYHSRLMNVLIISCGHTVRWHYHSF